MLRLKMSHEFSKKPFTEFLSEDLPEKYLTVENIRGLIWQIPDEEINQYSFRTHHVMTEDTNSIMAMGCSASIGMGMEFDKRWSNVLEDISGRTVYNLSCSGLGIDGIYRLIKVWLPRLKSKDICILFPRIQRREFWSEEQDMFVCFGPWKNTVVDPEYSKQLRKLLRSEDDVRMLAQMSMDAIKNVCKENNVGLHTIDLEPQGIHHLDIAGDAVHPGPLSHKNWAEKFYDKIQNN